LTENNRIRAVVYTSGGTFPSGDTILHTGVVFAVIGDKDHKVIACPMVDDSQIKYLNSIYTLTFLSKSNLEPPLVFNSGKYTNVFEFDFPKEKLASYRIETPILETENIVEPWRRRERFLLSSLTG
jgi:hypothetical protein